MKFKLKTRKAVRKRFKVSKRGKILHAQAGRRHLLTGKPGSKGRRLRRWAPVDSTDEKRIKAALPYG